MTRCGWPSSTSCSTVLVIVPGVLVCGLLAALYVHNHWPLSSFARVCFFSPYVVSATVIGLVWVWLLDTQFGLVNHYLSYVGIDNIPWLTSTRWSLYGVSITSIWWDMGLAFVLILAALQDIPGDLYDAVEVDGATRWQRFWYVTLPMLKPVLSMVITLQLISTLRIFSQVYVMTSGGPASSSTSVLFEIYTVAIRNQKFGLGAAMSVLLFVVILAVTLLSRRLIRGAAVMTALQRFLRSYNMRPSDVPVWLFGLAVAALWIMPFVWMISTSFKYPGDVMTAEIEWLPRRFTFQNYIDIFTKYNVWRWTLNSVIVVFASTFLCVLSGALAGYALARHEFSRQESFCSSSISPR